MSRFLLVVLEEDLEQCHITRSALFASLKIVSGVQSITDLEVISPKTLEQWMLPRQLSLVPDPPKRRKPDRT